MFPVLCLPLRRRLLSIISYLCAWSSFMFSFYLLYSVVCFVVVSGCVLCMSHRVSGTSCVFVCVGVVGFLWCVVVFAMLLVCMLCFVL